MLKQIIEIAAKLFAVTKDVQQTKFSDTNAAERKMLALQLDNTLLKFERRLPQGNQDTP